MSCAPAFGESGYSELESGGGGHHRRPPGVDGGDDLFGVDALQVDPAPRGAMRKEMTDDERLIRVGWDAGPGLLQQLGEAGGHLGRGIARRGVKRPDDATAGRYCQTPARVLARPKGRAKANWW